MKADFIDLIPGHFDQKIAILDNKTIDAKLFLYHVNVVAKQLPDHQYAINLCKDRYNFFIAFAAVLLRQQTNLLPPNQTAAAIQDVSTEFGSCYCLTDHDIKDLALPQFHIQNHLDLYRHIQVETETADQMPTIAAEHIACIVFTSGSTGEPTPNYKKWRDLVSVAQATQEWLNIEQNDDLTIVATVPPQHMYGLETSIMLPLISGVQIYSRRPFFPEDLRTTLDAIPGPIGLVTTPIHLRTCVESNINWPSVDFILSATAPLAANIASAAEQQFNCKVMEIYGCTESGSIAHRRTIDGEAWTLYQDMTLSQIGEDFYINSYHIEHPVRLNDNLEIHDSSHFSLLGRKSDLVIIAGKRASLADLNKKLLNIIGVNDATIFCPEVAANEIPFATRLVAFVVAPELDESEILAILRKHVDAAFLPRPIYKVNKLPRESTGKLPLKNLNKLLADLRGKS